MGMSSEVDVIRDKKSVHRTEEEEYKKKNLLSLVLIRAREVSRFVRRKKVNRALKWNNSCQHLQLPESFQSQEVDLLVARSPFQAKKMGSLSLSGGVRGSSP